MIMTHTPEKNKVKGQFIQKSKYSGNKRADKTDRIAFPANGVGIVIVD